ncbi:HEPN-associated N-terminal domain-containing protein [Demequina activiva]|uniref:RES domain-containing protein n=1 Tax=Demequina activiva TaxID=1582364 RepID=A0A919Q5A9_9MICO|nr:HEPN-associated N-terminal domain-containing protein [Demequina activiva]GIG54543.1 hypothetical protein Dac01nite_12950 [Demequina activiva]
MAAVWSREDFVGNPWSRKHRKPAAGVCVTFVGRGEHLGTTTSQKVRGDQDGADLFPVYEARRVATTECAEMREDPAWVRDDCFMGLAKRMWMEQEAQGWSYSDKYVCAGCVDDEVLQAAVAGAVEDGEKCSFCGAAGAASLDVLTEAFVVGIGHYYGDPDAELVPWESREGGYQVATYSTGELMMDFGDVLTGPGVLDAVEEAIGDRDWVEALWMESKRDAALESAWDRFRHAVMHETRFIYWLADGDDESWLGAGDIPASRFLHHFAQMVVDHDLIVEFAPGEAFHRAQIHSGPAIDGGATAYRLGTAPYELSMRPNRMNPAGIPMFYGALEPETAIAEVSAHTPGSGDHVTVGTFVASERIDVVDLTRLPVLPSVFDPERGGDVRREIQFMHSFVKELQRPSGELTAAVDYVPTQVVTEFILRALHRVVEGVRQLSGVIYPSVALVGGRALVLDVDNSRCVDELGKDPEVAPRFGPTPDRLRLVLAKDSVKTRPLR